MTESFDSVLREQIKNTPPINQLAEEDKLFEEAVQFSQKNGTLKVVDYITNSVNNTL